MVGKGRLSTVHQAFVLALDCTRYNEVESTSLSSVQMENRKCEATIRDTARRFECFSSSISSLDSRRMLRHVNGGRTRSSYLMNEYKRSPSRRCLLVWNIKRWSSFLRACIEILAARNILAKFLSFHHPWRDYSCISMDS